MSVCPDEGWDLGNYKSYEHWCLGNYKNAVISETINPGGAHKANGVNGLLYSARDLSSQQILSLKLDEMSINSACMIRILKEQG